MWEHFRTNIAYRVISLLLAITLWAWVTTAQNPIKEALYEIPLEPRDLPADLVVADKPSTVKIRVQARESTLDNVTSRDYQAYVNLTNAQVGTNVVPVEVSLPRGVEVINASPSQVSIIIDQITEVQKPVRPRLEGSVSTGFSVLDPTISPTEVLVAGPKSVLDQIAEVVVDVSLKGQRESYLERVPVKIYDEAGNPLQDWLKLQPSTVEVFVPIVRDLPSKKIVIKPVLKGESSEKYTVKQVLVEPGTVQLFGRWELLEDIDYLFTQEVDLTEADGNLVKEVDLEVPEGTYLGVPSRVRVIIEME